MDIDFWKQEAEGWEKNFFKLSCENSILSFFIKEFMHFIREHETKEILASTSVWGGRYKFHFQITHLEKEGRYTKDLEVDLSYDKYSTLNEVNSNIRLILELIDSVNLKVDYFGRSELSLFWSICDICQYQVRSSEKEEGVCESCRRKIAAKTTKKAVPKEVFRNFLEEKGFISEYKVGEKRLDYFHPELNLCIEVDGKDHKPEKDKPRDRHFFFEKGITTVRFLNEEIEQDLMSHKIKIEKYFLGRRRE